MMPRALRRLSNFRDLGGIAGADGRPIRRGELFRSGHLAKLRDEAGQALRDRFEIRAVADLRSDSEVAERPDVRVDGVRYLTLPPLTDEQNPSINRTNRRAVLDRLMARQDGTRGYLRETYRTLVTSPMALEAYRRLLRLLIDMPEGGVLWHCTQGKDRAGVGTAIVLMALGVSREDILRDYLSTNRALRLKNSLITAGVFLISFNLRMVRSLRDLLTARREYLEAAFDEVDRRYGGTPGFLHEALGLTDGDIDRLRESYLAA